METIDECEMLDLTLRRPSQETASHKPAELSAAIIEHGSRSKCRKAIQFIKHQDFVPDKRKRGGIVEDPIYEPFR